MISDEGLIEFWKNLTLALQAELIQRGDRIAELEAARAALTAQLDVLDAELAQLAWLFRDAGNRLPSTGELAERVRAWLDLVADHE